MITLNQCPRCSAIGGKHTDVCPFTTKVFPANGEVCTRCHEDVGEHYTHIEHEPGVEVVGEPDEVVCLGCALSAAAERWAA